MNKIGKFIALTLTLACTKVPTDANSIASLQFNAFPTPSVVLGDTLRDSTGKIAPITARAFNYSGSEVGSAKITFFAIDRGIRVDSLTGIVIGDSLRTTAARIGAVTGALEALRGIFVTLRPDTVEAGTRDSLLYSLTDSTLNVSPPLSVTVRHTLTRADSAVGNYLVNFAVISQTDTLAAQLVTDAGFASRVDTTDASGIASRRIKVRPTRLTNVSDSVIVLASVRYRGSHVRGSPARLVLRVKPR